MLLDEAFEKMDPQNVRSAVTFLNGLGLQLILAGPESDQAKLSSFLNIYYDMSRFGSRNVRFSKTIVHEQARHLLQSDSYHVHPDLLARTIAQLESDRAAGRCLATGLAAIGIASHVFLEAEVPALRRSLGGHQHHVSTQSRCLLLKIIELVVGNGAERAATANPTLIIDDEHAGGRCRCRRRSARSAPCQDQRTDC